MTDRNGINSRALIDEANRLETRFSGVADKVSITVETDLDEAFFVGTPESFVRLAAALLRAAAREGSPQMVGELPCWWSTFTHDAVDGMSQVVVGAECVVTHDEQRQALVAHFRRLSGEGPR